MSGRDANQLARALKQADRLASQVHDAMWAMDFEKTSAGQFERDEWNRLRKQASDRIWEIHHLLRPLIAPEEKP